MEASRHSRFGTAIAAIWTPKEIIVAADSKVYSDDGSVIPTLYSKILQEGQFFFVVEGMREDNETGFDGVSIIRQALRENKTFKEKLEAFDAAIQRPLMKGIQYVYDNNRTFFKRNLKGGLAMGVFFFGVEDGNLVLARRCYEIKMRERRVRLKSVWNVDVPNPFQPPQLIEAYMTPEGEILESFISKNPLDTVMADPIGAARRFVETAIAAAPDFIGPPVDIIKVTTEGAEWVQRKSECPDIVAFSKA